MHAVQVTGYATQPALVEVERPRPGPTDVLVLVAGAALNPLDVKIKAGQMEGFFPVDFPYTLGTDVSGTVLEVGADVTGWARGDRAVARLDPVRGGAFAEAVVVPADQLVAPPKSLPLPRAAGIVTTAATAWQALVEVAALQPGHRILVHGGAGGVGSFAVQLAHDLGATVWATASGPGVDVVRDLGAHHVIDHTRTDFRSEVADLDLVLDTVGGPVEEMSLDVLRPDGLLVALPVPPDVERAQARGRRAEFVVHASDGARLAEVVAWIDRGMRLLVDAELPLPRATEAFDLLERGHPHGKLLLLPETSAAAA